MNKGKLVSLHRQLDQVINDFSDRSHIYIGESVLTLRVELDKGDGEAILDMVGDSAFNSDKWTKLTH